MKVLYITLVFASVLSLGSSKGLNSNFDQALPHLGGIAEGLTSVLRAHLKGHIDAAFAGKKFEADGDLRELLSTFEGASILPYPLYVRADVQNLTIRGLADLVPDVKIDLIRRTLDVKYVLPRIVAEGDDYTLALATTEEDFANAFKIVRGSGTASLALNNLELDIHCSLQFSWSNGWSVNQLNYLLHEFSADVDVPNLELFELLGISTPVNIWAGWYLHRELVGIEAQYHEGLVEIVRAIIDSILWGNPPSF